ncbi:MAG: hypothetical protein ACXWJ2_02510 [Hyphomicrobium sp.]
MLRIGAFAFLLSTAALACGCAGAPAESPPLLVNDPPPLANDTAALLGYQLTDEEKKYDCKKLTGKMQVRILQMRGYDTHAKASTLARTAQAVTTPIFGGTKEGLDPDGQYRKDRAMLEAFNRELANKKCKTFDIDAELGKTDGTPQPIPTTKTKQ